MSKREEFLRVVESFEGSPTLWGRKGPDAFDCSGTVTYALKVIGGPDLTDIENAQALHDHSRALGNVPTDKPQAGDLVFYGHGPDTVIHVATLRASGGVVSADGATSHITSLEVAKANPANRVRFHQSMLYRADTPFVVVHRNLYVDQLDLVER